MELRILQLKKNCPMPERFSHIKPGSAIVERGTDTCNGRVLYFEGGIYSRIGESTPDQRELYAKLAAGRAVEGYPTIALIWVSNPELDWFEEIGFVDSVTYEVRWLRNEPSA